MPAGQLAASAADELFELASIHKVDTLLSKALSVAVRLLGAEAGSILFQGQPVLVHRAGPFRPEALKRIEHWEQVVSRRLLDTAWHIPTTGALPISTSKAASNQLALVNIPLLRDSTVVGSLSLVLSPGNELTPSLRQRLGQIAQGIGQLASLVAEFESAQQRLNQIGVFYQIGQALVTTFDINQLLSDAMQLAANVIDAGAASIMLIDEDRKELIFEVSHGTRSKMLRQQRIPLDEGIAGWVARHGHPVIANNARTDPRFSHRVDVRTGFLTQSIAAVPLKVKGHIIGVLEVLNKYSGDGFNHGDIQLMNSIAAQVAIAIENARLYQRVQQEKDQIIRAEENARQMLAQSLHEGPLQGLLTVSTRLEQLEGSADVKSNPVQNELEELRKLVRGAMRSTREVLYDLRPAMIETQGLVVALEQYIDQVRAAERFTVHFETIESLKFGSEVAATIFSIVYEAISNVERHAHARNVWLSLEQQDNRCVVTVRDDGRGFDVEAVKTVSGQNEAFGLSMMRERADAIEAALLIESRLQAPNQGTTVQLIISLENLGRNR